jgi:hypothetical protein
VSFDPGQPLGDVWDLDDNQFAAMSDRLAAIMTRAEDTADPRAIARLEQVFDESWKDIQEKASVESSEHVMWWSAGVMALYEAMKDKLSLQQEVKVSVYGR